MKTLDKINNLKNQYSSRFIKYQRNLRKYYNCPNISLDNIRQSTAVGLMLDGNGFAATALAKPSINIIMSIIDTLTSKIATMKARPFFNTVDGTYADRQYVIQVQKYFDTYFDREYVSSKIVSAFKNACIFDTGYLFVEDGHILNLLPWQVYIDRAEQTYGNTASYPALNVNSIGVESIKVYLNGKKKTVTTNWDAGTSMTLMYDGTDFVVLGNPVVMSNLSPSSGYIKYANGLIIQWKYCSSGSNNTVSNKSFSLPISHSNTDYAYFLCPVGYIEDVTVNWNRWGLKKVKGNIVQFQNLIKEGMYIITIGY